MLALELLPSCASLDEAKSLVHKRLKELKSSHRSLRFLRYFEPRIHRIIKEPWPLDYWIVRQLLVKSDFESFDQLQCFEQVVNPKDLQSMFAELKTRKRGAFHAAEFRSKWESLVAEADCAIFLGRIGALDIKYVREHGDWEFRLSGKTLQAEVKNVQPHSFNLECVKDALFGKMSLVSSPLRNYRSVFISATDVHEGFRDAIIGIVHEHLPSLLALPEVGGTEASITMTDGTKVVCCRSVDVDGSEAAEVEISTLTGKQCSIEFKRAIDFPDLVSATIQSSDDFWWGNPEPNWNKIEQKIKDKVQDALNQLKNLTALIFIRLNLHPMFEEHVRAQKGRLAEMLAEILNSTLGATNQRVVIQIPCYFAEDRFQPIFSKAARDFETLWAHVAKPVAL